MIWGDRDLLLSLLYNLLDNAVKAVEEGGFILMKGSKRTQGYEIKVVDNGRGIPQEEIARITEAFYMVDKSRSRKEGGAGIGMALCQKIITLHQGELKIDSKLGEGTVMRLYFPGEKHAVKIKATGEQKAEYEKQENKNRRNFLLCMGGLLVLIVFAFAGPEGLLRLQDKSRLTGSVSISNTGTDYTVWKEEYETDTVRRLQIWQTVSLWENSTISLNRIMKLQRMVKYIV